jgi:hypothetical protein
MWPLGGFRRARRARGMTASGQAIGMFQPISHLSFNAPGAMPSGSDPSVPRVKPAAMGSGPQGPDPGEVTPQDALELSPLAREAGALPADQDTDEQPIRHELVRRVRREIEEGRYVTPDKLDVVVDRLHEELGGA